MESQDDIFLKAREIIDAVERSAYLTKACGGDAQLRQRVEAMLRDAEKADDFFGPENKFIAGAGLPLTEAPGTVIGRYKLLQKIGEGGMGVVYMAEQREPVIRKVALKIIKLGMDTKQVVGRFEAERQALALMDHPSIAKVLEAGATETGRPYFVMELVRGVRITECCDQNNLTTEQRLDLFLQVCKAVQHAHQKGIIHRDIKPSNILVADHDGMAVPKIIDFGIAKATTGQRLTEKTLFTAFEQFIGTPVYMSPEQASFSGLDVDTRTDIYSLGILLYELLTGKTPFNEKQLLAAGLEEMRRTIREAEPSRPSTALSTMHEGELSTTAKHRRTDPPKLIHRIRGDLDWIVMKCLEKDRARRYETANGLAMDVQRHLQSEPVVARPPSQLYRFVKLVRRNKAVFSSAVAITLALVGGLAVSTWSLVKEKAARERAVAAERASEVARQSEATLRVRAEADEQRARDEAAKSTLIAQYLQGMLKSIDPDLARGRDTTLLREVLDRTAERIRKELTNQTEVEAELWTTIGEVYAGIGEPTRAEPMFRDALAIWRKLRNKDDPNIATLLSNLGMALQGQGKYTDAEDPCRESLAMRRRIFGSEHADVAQALNRLALVLGEEGKLTEAERLFRESLAMKRKLFGNEHKIVAHSLTVLSGVLIKQTKLEEAEAAARESLTMYRKLLGDKDPNLDLALADLGYVLAARGRYSEAEPLFREALAYRRTYYGNEHTETATCMSGLAAVLRGEGKLTEAESLFRECLAVREKRVPDAWYTFFTRARLGTVLLEQKNYAEAEPLLLSGYEGMLQRKDKIRTRKQVFATIINAFTQLCEATSRPDQAMEWKKKLAALDESDLQVNSAEAPK